MKVHHNLQLYQLYTNFTITNFIENYKDITNDSIIFDGVQKIPPGQLPPSEFPPGSGLGFGFGLG